MSLDITLLELVRDKVSVCPNCGHETDKVYWESVYEVNITHNLGRMASEAGLYDAMWRPYRLLYCYTQYEDHNEELRFERENIVYAKDIITKLILGIEKMKTDKQRLLMYNPENGWGRYETLLSVAEEYLEACQEHPDAKIEVSR